VQGSDVAIMIHRVVADPVLAIRVGMQEKGKREQAGNEGEAAHFEPPGKRYFGEFWLGAELYIDSHLAVAQVSASRLSANVGAPSLDLWGHYTKSQKSYANASEVNVAVRSLR